MCNDRSTGRCAITQHNAPPTIPYHTRTLLVEANTEIQHMLELALAIKGHIVTACDNTSEAREILHGNHYGIVIIGTLHEDTGSFEFAREIRVRSGGRPVLVLLVSDGEQRIFQGCDLSVADEILPWPTDMNLLRHRFDRIRELATKRTASPDTTSSKPRAEPFLVLTAGGAIRSAGDVAESLFGFPPGTLPGANGFSFFHSDDAPILLSIVTECLVTAGHTRTVEVRARGTWRPITIAATNKLDDPDVGGIMFSLKGLDTRGDWGNQITRGGSHDPATGLPNSALFLERIDHAIARSARHDHHVIVMTIDFNGFRDETGQQQEVDDDLLIALSQRIRSCLRMSDTVARLRYDEFGILLEDIVDAGNAQIVADLLIRTLDVPFFDSGRGKQLTPGIALAISSPDRFRASDLLGDANIARSWARVQESGRSVVFDPSMVTPDDEPMTSQRNIPDVMAAVEGRDIADSSSVDDRLATLQQRVNALERGIERMVRQESLSR